MGDRRPRTLWLELACCVAACWPAAAQAQKAENPVAQNETVEGDVSEELRLSLEADSVDEKTWRYALARKAEPRELPAIAPSPADLARMGKGYGPVFVGGTGKAKVMVSKLHRAERLAPLGGLAVAVEAGGERLDGFLLVPIDERLGNLEPESLRIARWSEPRERYEWVHGSGVLRHEGVVWARIARGGDYAVFGELADDLLAGRVRTYCASRTELELSLEGASVGRLNDLCPRILCEAGLEPGTGPFEPGRPGSPMGGNICDLCLGTPTVPLEPCEIYLPPRIPECDEHCGWQTVGPMEIAGHVHRIVPDPSNGNRVYAAAYNGGIWVLDSVSSYPGTKWRPLTDRLDDLQMSALAVAPSNTRTLYAGSRAGRIYRSTNRGTNWLQVGGDLGNDIRDIVVDPADDEHLWSFNDTGLRESEDGGEVWSVVFGGDVSDFKIDPSDSDVWYLAEWGVGVHRSETAGASWEQIFDFADATNPGTGRIEIALGVRNADGSMQGVDSRTVVVRAADEVFLNDTSGSGAWSNLGVRGNWGTPLQLDWNNVVAVSPFDPRVVFAGGRVLHRRRADDTNTWDHVAGFGGKGHEDQHSVAFHPTDPDIVYLANDGGVYRSVDGGLTFHGGEDPEDEIAAGRDLDYGLVTAELYRSGVEGDDALANLYHSGIIGSTDLDDASWHGVEGHSWEFRSILDDERRARRYFVLSNPLRVRFYPSASGEPNLATFGEFEPVPSSGGSRIVGSIAADRRSGSNVVLAAANATASDNHRLMITAQADRIPVFDEATSTWTNVPNWDVAFETGNQWGDTISAVAFAGRTAKVYAMTIDGRVFVDTDLDASTTFAQVGQWTNPDGGIRQMVVAPGSGELVYAIRRHAVARSRDGGQAGTWTEVGGATLPATEITSIAHHPTNEFTVFLGAEDGVYMSVDQGETWEPIDNSLPNTSVRQIFVQGEYLYAITHGRGLWRLPLCAIPRGA